MYNGNYKQITFVIYDSIENSVFESQVRDPLLAVLNANPHCEVTLISFEKETLSHTKIQSIIPVHDRLHFILARKFPFIGKLTLYPATEQLKRILSYVPSDHLIARGPLAGWIILRALNKRCLTKNFAGCSENCLCLPRITIQARGLAAEEYRFAYHEKRVIIKKWFQQFIYRELDKIEQEVFGTKNYSTHMSLLTIEAVSPALKEYLISRYKADPRTITIASNDLPPSFSPEQRTQWRHEVRQQLSIPDAAEVYCYSGSAKPWQCGKETIEYFKMIYASNKNAVLLIYSQNKDQFEEWLFESQLPPASYRLMSIKSDQLYRYLAAADYGMLFRQKDIINWVSRPTKMLEYEAVGLKIMHNNTIGWLADKKPTAS